MWAGDRVGRGESDGGMVESDGAGCPCQPARVFESDGAETCARVGRGSHVSDGKRCVRQRRRESAAYRTASTPEEARTRSELSKVRSPSQNPTARVGRGSHVSDGKRCVRQRRPESAAYRTASTPEEARTRSELSKVRSPSQNPTARVGRGGHVSDGKRCVRRRRPESAAYRTASTPEDPRTRSELSKVRSPS